MNKMGSITLLSFILSVLFSVAHGNGIYSNNDLTEYYNCLNGCNIDLNSPLGYEHAECIADCQQLHLKKK